MVVGRTAVFIAALTALLVVGCTSSPAAGTPAPSSSIGTPTPTSTALSTPNFATQPPASAGAEAVTSAAQAAALVFASNPLFNSIKAANGGSVGQAAEYDAQQSGDGFSVTVTMGSGDCLSGCINRHTWLYSVSGDGTVTLMSEQGDEVETTIDHGTSDLATVTVRLVAGPVCPVEQNPPDPSCAPRPVPAAQVVLRDSSGAEVATAAADATGIVTFSVPGGAYYVETAAVQGLMRQAQAQAFSVPGGRSVTIALEYDTGIR